MRIVGGTLGGRPLLAPKGRKVRPTPARAREAIFSSLGDISGLEVADLFAGTGALAIEAISRGAASAVLVDRDTRAAEGNLRHLEITDRCRLVRSDATTWLLAQPREPTFDLILLDPPYSLWPDLGEEAGEALAALLRPGGRVVAESSPGSPPVVPGLDRMRERRYGRTLITFLGLPGERPGE